MQFFEYTKPSVIGTSELYQYLPIILIIIFYLNKYKNGVFAINSRLRLVYLANPSQEKLAMKKLEINEDF